MEDRVDVFAVINAIPKCAALFVPFVSRLFRLFAVRSLFAVA